MGITILCGAAFLFIKLAFEWPPKFSHFGAFIRKDKQEHYEKYLGNEHARANKLPARNEISGHLEAVEFTYAGGNLEAVEKFADRKGCVIAEAPEHGAAAAETHAPAVPAEAAPAPTAPVPGASPTAAAPAGEAAPPAANATPPAPGAAPAPAPENHAPAVEGQHAGKMYVMQAKKQDAGFWPSVAKSLEKIEGVKLVAFEVKPDPLNEKPLDPENDKPHFIPKTPNHDAAPIKIEAADVDHWSSFTPQHSTYFSTYFMITGLHGLHVLGGVLVFAFLWGPGAALYRKNPEHLANRVEVAGLFWHFVDLIWIFVFPLFYLL
jgi:hypothetical protein